MILLDTNILIFHSKGLLSLPSTVQDENLMISAVSRGEIAEGLHSALMGFEPAETSIESLRQEVARIGHRYDAIPFGKKEADSWALLNALLRRNNHFAKEKTAGYQSFSIKESDMMIAATALANGMRLVTTDKSDFGKIAKLESLLKLEIVPTPK